MRRRIGVWLIGARGGLATTAIAGARLIARGISPETGLLTATPPFDGLDLAPLGDLVFGGHEIRGGSLWDAALEIVRDTGTLDASKLRRIRADLARIDRDIRPGTAVNAGSAIQSLAPRRRTRDVPLADILRTLSADIAGFRRRHRLDACVVVNLASTEPPLPARRIPQTLEDLRRVIARDDAARLRASTLYATAALETGSAFINFTPSEAATIPAIGDLASRLGLPYMGRDGKTGETLVKSALAPMFKYRNLRVLAWQGYNILGDRDGQILADHRHKASKIRTKDSVLSGILGYPLHTHVGIDFVPSLKDMKTAWDYVHFQGFLDVKMSLQFIWQGCDAILAAPLVLDMVRLADLSLRLGEAGPMSHLACFFKKPLGAGSQDLHFQFHDLMRWVAERTGGRVRRPSTGKKGGIRRA